MAYENLAFTHRKEYARRIDEAKWTRRATGGSPTHSRCCAKARPAR